MWLRFADARAEGAWCSYHHASHRHTDLLWCFLLLAVWLVNIAKHVRLHGSAPLCTAAGPALLVLLVAYAYYCKQWYLRRRVLLLCILRFAQVAFAAYGDAFFTFAEPARTTPAFLSKTVLGSKAIMLACLALGLQLPFHIHLPVHGACLALLLATNSAACASPYATGAGGRAQMASLAGALTAGLKHVWMLLSPERLRFGQRRQCELVLALLQLQLGALLPTWLVYVLEARSRAAFEARVARTSPVQAPSVVLALTLVPLSAVGLRSLEALDAAYALWD